MEEKHLFTKDGQYFNQEVASEKNAEFNSSVMPLVRKWLDEGYPLSEILHFIHGSIEFELIMNRLG